MSRNYISNTRKLHNILYSVIKSGKLNIDFIHKKRFYSENDMSELIKLSNRKMVVSDIYEDLDKQIQTQIVEKNAEPLCKKGCNCCCSDYFYISEAEFALIYDYIQNGNLDLEKYRKKAVSCNEIILTDFNDEYEKLAKSAKDSYISTFNVDNGVSDQAISCPFLDDKGDCAVYEVRPLICRYFGLDMHYNSCNKIIKKFKKPFANEFNSKKIESHTLSLNSVPEYLAQIDCVTVNNLSTHFKPAPIYWWLLNFDTNSQTNKNLCVQSYFKNNF